MVTQRSAPFGALGGLVTNRWCFSISKKQYCHHFKYPWSLWGVWDSACCASVLFYSWYNSALLITLTLSLTSCSDGDLLGLVTALRVCQERVRWATFLFVRFLFRFFPPRRKKNNNNSDASKSFLSVLVYLSRFSWITGQRWFVREERLKMKIKYYSGFPPNSAEMNQRCCLCCQSAMHPALNTITLPFFYLNLF